MASRFLDITGQKFGRLMALEMVPRGPEDRHTKWLCQCECGKIIQTRINSLRSGNTKSCGCYFMDYARKRGAELGATHGLSKHPLFDIWNSMRTRCTRPNDVRYKDYGGRGIYVCERWLESPQHFFDDMGDRPEGGTLDRINNDGPYSPENCRWVSQKVQARNKRSNHLLEFNGSTKPLIDWATELGFSPETIHRRLRVGWSVEKTLSTPVDIRHRNSKARNISTFQTHE